MNTEQNKPGDDIRDPEVKKALERGRNANDNFNDEETDDYGIEKDSADGAADQIERDQIKGGSGQHGTERNRNDDFDNDTNN